MLLSQAAVFLYSFYQQCIGIVISQPWKISWFKKYVIVMRASISWLLFLFIYFSLFLKVNILSYYYWPFAFLLLSTNCSFFFFLSAEHSLLEMCPRLVYPNFLPNSLSVFPWNSLLPHPHPQFQPPGRILIFMTRMLSSFKNDIWKHNFLICEN